ncbi:XRE family transcriptional regulator [Metallosphaera tengchongensis]|uniref:XRE family transcriptional regulator n=1 Tax=Metallosphaera tengchongensis TaxID=1532350 RepID=A0A6N0NYI3_9CREN|nr:helix-turn-helix domain-containing protein [Metallosphaera tengchongensis]QKR00201.1 XRE family transcriptional regulator [Metallosphaera tengchongensis]
MKRIYRAKFSILHKGCWTEKVGSKVLTLRISQYNRKKVNVMIASPDLIVKDLSSSENVDEVLRYRKMKGGYLIEFLEDSKSSISGVVLDVSNNLLEFRNRVYKGVESWQITSISKSAINNIVETFRPDTFAMEEIDLQDILGYGLTEKEMETLRVALSMGYFSYPRSVKARDVAKSMGVSKQDFLYHLRNAINKMVTSYNFDM